MRTIYRTLFRLVFGTRFEPLLYRWFCPYPIAGNVTARSCYRAGTCGCDNAPTPRPHGERND